MKMSLMAMMAAMMISGSVMAGTGGVNWPSTMGTGEIPCGAPGVFYRDAERTTYLGARYNLRQFQVLGPVKATRTLRTICVFFSSGDSPYYKLLASAKEKYPDADEIVNIEIVAHTVQYFLFYTKTDVILMGTAVKYKK